MTVVQFYHLTQTPLERALPKLAEKAYSGGFRTHLLLDAPERVEYFNQLLWTYAQDSFLPHGTKQDAEPEMQPVFLSSGFDAPNAPDLLFVTEGSVPQKPEEYKRILDMFDGKSEERLQAARARWKQYKDAGHEVSYFQQNEKGGWEKKA
jgi:DNA polymerase-3 subunit chi